MTVMSLWRGLVTMGVGMALVACSHQPPTPEWALAARDGTERGNLAHLSGQTRVANTEWQRARQAAASTGDPLAMARVALAQCAAQVASLQLSPEPEPCTRADVWLQAQPSAALAAYRRYLQGRVAHAADVALLPAAHQATAPWLLAAPQAGAEGARERSASPALDDARWADALRAMPDPLSRLVAAAVAWRSGQAGPAVMAEAAATASAQGWSRPLLAWLGLHAQWAERAGDAALALRLRQRMDWVLNPLTTP
ncbi:hypothetical protein [Hydrogenophaga soli]